MGNTIWHGIILGDCNILIIFERSRNILISGARPWWSRVNVSIVVMLSFIFERGMLHGEANADVRLKSMFGAIRKKSSGGQYLCVRIIVLGFKMLRERALKG